MFKTLAYIGQKLNEGRVLWGVGASILLNCHGLVEKPNDIDILVALKDIGKAEKILNGIGEKQKYEKTSSYSTKYFYEYIVNGFDVDVMAGLRINFYNGTFEHFFDYKSISEIKKINGVDIPLTSLEDWYVIYQLIPNREIKVKIIENYLLLNGIKKPTLLVRALKGNLPKEVREKIKKQIRERNKLENTIKVVNELIDSVPNAIISSVDEEGYPNIKAMLPPRMRDGMKHIFFSTNSSSIRVQQYTNNPKACIYFYDNEQFKGVMLKGIMEVFYDAELKQMIWRDGDEKYYSKGVFDPDYCVLRFTVQNGRYYSNFKSIDFIIE